MIVVRYKHETDENYFLSKMKKMRMYLDEVIDCVEDKDADYEDEEDEDFEEPEYRERGTMSRRRSTMSRRSRSSATRGRYNY